MSYAVNHILNFWLGGVLPCSSHSCMQFLKCSKFEQICDILKPTLVDMVPSEFLSNVSNASLKDASSSGLNFSTIFSSLVQQLSTSVSRFLDMKWKTYILQYNITIIQINMFSLFAKEARLSTPFRTFVNSTLSINAFFLFTLHQPTPRHTPTIQILVKYNWHHEPSLLPLGPELTVARWWPLALVSAGSPSPHWPRPPVSDEAPRRGEDIGAAASDYGVWHPPSLPPYTFSIRLHSPCCATLQTILTTTLSDVKIFKPLP